MLVVLLTTSSVMAQGEPELQWELVNPFRFIHDQDSIDELRRVYAELELDENGKKTAYNFERELQKRSEEVVEGRRKQARERKDVDCDNPRSDTEKRQCFEPYLGWFARLAEGNHAKTCWDSDKRRFRNKDFNKGVCSDYINPKKHRVRVWVSDSQLLGGRVPQWFIDNELQPNPDKCAPIYQKGVCVEFDIDYDHKERIISARFSDGSFTIKPTTVVVEDNLIVGLGDSYAAGEGNPDMPARFTQGKGERDFLYNFLTKGLIEAIKGLKQQAPRKDNKPGVLWLDRHCHRSMYSYQFKTALQFALANPQKSVTYVTYSCSGAETSHIMDKEQGSNETSKKVKPQLESLREVLTDGKKEIREIDYLLLSAGGNDIKFGDLVAYVVLNSKLLAGLKRFGKISKEQIIADHTIKKFETILLGNGKGNYYKLHDALLKEPEGTKPNESKRIKIKDCVPGELCKRILLTPYPNIFNDENGDPCQVNRKEFDIPFLEDDTRAQRISLLKDHVFDQIRDVQQSPEIKRGLGWTVIENNVNAYLKNGFCAQKAESSSQEAQSSSKTGEKFEMPTRVKKQAWRSFNPWNYKSYEKRQRWVRLPVDAKLTTDQVLVIAKKIRVDHLLKDDRSNIMHPTAEGLSKTADENLKVIEEFEELERKAKSQQ